MTGVRRAVPFMQETFICHLAQIKGYPQEHNDTILIGGKRGH